MIEIKEFHFIAEGIYQKCYEHPSNNNLCIKIPKPDAPRDRVAQEIAYYKKMNKKNTLKFEYPFFSVFRGEQETNLGNGFVFDLIRDETTGQISKTLDYYLVDAPNKIENDNLKKEFNRLVDQMIVHKVIVTDLWARNICCKLLNTGKVQLIVIDGLGHRDFIPVADLFVPFARKKIRRRLEKNHFTSFDKQRKRIIELRNRGVG